MKLLIALIILTPLLFAAALNPATNASDTIEKCLPNPDRLYDRQKVLNQLADVLNVAAPGFKNYEATGFYVQDERPRLFFVYDLTDLSNKGSSLSCVDFKNNHVYHFAPHYIPFSFSHILILEDGNLKIFKSINCANTNDRIEDVVSNLNKTFRNDPAKVDIINRVKDYRKYGSFFTIDDTSIRCGLK